jgi:hypothetical protein
MVLSKERVKTVLLALFIALPCGKWCGSSLAFLSMDGGGDTHNGWSMGRGKHRADARVVHGNF